MAKNVTTYRLHELLKEIQESDGLPENLSTEAQLWDEIFKKEAFLMSEQIFPLILEVHGKAYPKDTPIKPLATEFSVERSPKKEITSIRADITLLVNERDIYHFECQIEQDGTMVLRMFEYDTHIALSYPAKTYSDLNSPQSDNHQIHLRFPNSAVLYLQDTKHSPDELKCQIQFQDGGTYEYTVPVLKVQSYSLEEIQQKHLCVLIPFLPLRFRKHLRRDRQSQKIHFNLEKEELTSFYQRLILMLEEEVTAGYLSENNRNAIISLLNKSMIRVFYQDESLIKEVIEMTEPILELEIEKYMKQCDDTTRRLEAAFEAFDRASQELEQKNWELSQTSQALQQKDLELSQTSQILEDYRSEQVKDKQLISYLQEQLAALQKQLAVQSS